MNVFSEHTTNGPIFLLQISYRHDVTSQHHNFERIDCGSCPFNSPHQSNLFFSFTKIAKLDLQGFHWTISLYQYSVGWPKFISSEALTLSSLLNTWLKSAQCVVLTSAFTSGSRAYWHTTEMYWSPWNSSGEGSLCTNLQLWKLYYHQCYIRCLFLKVLFIL